MRVTLLLAGVLASAWLVLGVVDTASLVPALWPAGGLAAGLLLTTPKRLQAPLLGAVFALVLARPPRCRGTTRAWPSASPPAPSPPPGLVRHRLVRGLEGRRAALLDQGDVSRLIGAITIGSPSPASAAA